MNIQEHKKKLAEIDEQLNFIRDVTAASEPLPGARDLTPSVRAMMEKRLALLRRRAWRP